MAETRALIGYGTILQFGDGNSPEAFTSVAEVTNITGPNLSRDIPDATHMQSPDGYKEFINGMKDGGEVVAELNFVPFDTTQNASTGIRSLFEDGVKRNWRMILPGSPT